MHRAIVGVASIGSAVIPMDPREPNNHWMQRSWPVFVEHKAFNIGRYELARAKGQLGLSPLEAARFDAFEAWRGMSDCEGLDDARLLPLNAFDRSREWPSLVTAGGRTDFDRIYGRSPRTAHGLRWSRDRAQHGRDVVSVAGYELPIGFHWDVLAERGAKTLVTHHEVWTLTGRRGRVNVYPDAHVREGDACRRTWPTRN